MSLRCEAAGMISRLRFVGEWWDLVKNDVISRFKVQVQLESLILAQSERWRQA